jgi:hypothetical protein
MTIRILVTTALRTQFVPTTIGDFAVRTDEAVLRTRLVQRTVNVVAGSGADRCTHRLYGKVSRGLGTIANAFAIVVTNITTSPTWFFPTTIGIFTEGTNCVMTFIFIVRAHRVSRI